MNAWMSKFPTLWKLDTSVVAPLHDYKAAHRKLGISKILGHGGNFRLDIFSLVNEKPPLKLPSLFCKHPNLKFEGISKRTWEMEVKLN